MRNLAKGLAVGVVALFTLVPVQASSSTALDGTLNVEPEVTSRVTGSPQVLTATLTAHDPLGGQVINFEWSAASPGEEAFCTTDATGICTVETTSTSPTTRTVRAYHEDGPPDALPCTGAGAPPAGTDCDETEAQNVEDADDTDVVTIEFLDGTLQVEKEDNPTAPSTEVQLTATVMSKVGTPKPLVANVDAEITDGPQNALAGTTPDMECDTDPTTGTCILKYTPGPSTGVDEVDAWVDRNDDPGPPPDGDTPSGDEVQGTGYEGDTSEGPDEGTAPGDTVEPDETDVVKVSISATQQLTLSPASSTKTLGTQSALTAGVFLGQTAQSGVKVAAIVLTGGAHAGQTATCDTGPNGQCTLNYTGTKAGVDKVRATVDTDGNGQPNEADSTEDIGNNGGTAEPDTTAVAQITWGTPAPPPPPPGAGGGGTSRQCDAGRSSAGQDEILVGTKKNDKLCGFGGDDSLRGLAGNDTLKGGKGDDTAKGGKGKDLCKAEEEKKSCER